MTAQPNSAKGFRDLLAASGPNGYSAIKAHAYPDVWGSLMGFKVDGRNYNFDGRMFLKDILRDGHREVCVRKGAQLGVTVTALLITMHRLCQWKWNCLYLLPVKAGTVTFTQGRINPIISVSPALKRQFVNVDNANHKRTKTNNLYIRGTNVVTELREIPVDFEIWDERDKMTEENLPLARTRMDGSRHKHLFILSTPTIPDYGVDADYKESDQRQWFIKCPHCSTQICLDWETHVKIDEDRPRNSRLECDHCHNEITHKQMLAASQHGQWIVTNGDHDPEMHGYHISQLYSPTRELFELARIWIKGQSHPDSMRELMNSALGLGYAAEGDKLTEKVLDSCRIDGYSLPEITQVTDREIHFGIDVGSVLHVQASVLDGDSARRKVLIKTMNWGEIHQLFAVLDKHNINFKFVIDANPERKMATDLCERFWGRGFLAFYTDNGELAQWTYPKHGGEVGRVNIDRTVAIDSSHATYLLKQVRLPANARDLGEKTRNSPFSGWYKQMMSQTRIIVPTTDNKGDRAKYVQTGGPDHWDHSDTYEFICSTLQAPPASELPQPGEMVTPDEIGMPDFMRGLINDEHGGFMDNDDLFGSGDGWGDGLGIVE